MDFDGVFTTTDSTAAWLVQRLRSRPLLLARCAPWLAGFGLTSRTPGPRSAMTGRLMTTAFAGQGAGDLLAELRSFGRAMARDPSMTRGVAVDEARALVSRGAELVIASAGLTPVIEAWARELDLPVVVCASAVSPRSTGRLGWDDHCFAERKVERLAALGWPEWDLVYSDSAHDLPLMRRSGAVVAVGPERLSVTLRDALPGTPVRAVRW